MTVLGNVTDCTFKEYYLILHAIRISSNFLYTCIDMYMYDMIWWIGFFKNPMLMFFQKMAPKSPPIFITFSDTY